MCHRNLCSSEFEKFYVTIFFEKLKKKKKMDLTHYQTTNFRLFRTERVRRRQFHI